MDLILVLATDKGGCKSVNVPRFLDVVKVSVQKPFDKHEEGG